VERVLLSHQAEVEVEVEEAEVEYLREVEEAEEVPLEDPHMPMED